MKRLVSLVLIALFAVAVPAISTPDVDAQAQIYVTGAAQAAASDIVNGRIVSTTSVEVNGEMHRATEIEISSTTKGDLQGSVIVETPGGERADGAVVYVSHTPELIPGELVQLALTPAAPETSYVLPVATDSDLPVYSVAGGSEGAWGLLPDGVGRAEAVGDYTLTGASWDSFSSAVPFNVNPANSGVSTAGTIAAVQRAFQTWEDDAGSDIDFAYTGTTTKSGLNLNDGQNTVSWVNPPAGSGWLAQASWIATGGGDIIGFDVRVSRSYNWSNGAASGRYDIGTVVAHEVGHGIGFGHAPSSAELMYFQIQGGTIKGLGAGDRSGAAFVYPTAAPAQLVSPSAGARLCSGNTVSWSGGSGNFWVTVGVPGAPNQFMSAGAGTNRSIVVSGIPSNVEALVTLWQASGSSYSVVAQQVQSACNPSPAQIVSPSAGARLCSGNTVSWSGGSGNFWVTVGVPGAPNQFMSAGTGTNRSIVVSGIPSNVETLVTLWQRQASQSSYSVVAQQEQATCN